MIVSALFKNNLFESNSIQLADGDHCHTLKEAQNLVIQERNEREEQNKPLTKEETAAILQYTYEQRELKATGARLTNRSAAKDVNFTSAKLQSEVTISFNFTYEWQLIIAQIQKLNARTGAAGVMFVTRGHLQDVYPPTVYETENATGFCKQSLGHNLPDIGGRLECWASTGKQGKEGLSSQVYTGPPTYFRTPRCTKHKRVTQRVC